MTEDTGLGGVIFVLVMLITGFALGYMQGKSAYQAQAIEHGYAEYDSQTGDWQWVEQKDE